MAAVTADRLALFQRLFLLIAGVWVGSLFTVGYLVVPTIFANLQDRQVAGMIAAAIFQAEAYVSVLVCVALLLLANALIKRKVENYRNTRWAILVLLLISALTCFGFIPYMNALRQEALLLGMPVMASPSASLFGRLHGISSGLFLIQSLLGLWMVWRLTRHPTNP
jgi:heme A synthase